MNESDQDFLEMCSSSSIEDQDQDGGLSHCSNGHGKNVRFANISDIHDVNNDQDTSVPTKKKLSPLELAGKSKEIRSWRKRLYRRNVVDLMIQAARIRSRQNTCFNCQSS